jgi:hypothetical protein
VAAGILLLALWTLLALVWETGLRQRHYQRAAETAVPASAWQLGSPQARRLEHFLKTVTVSMPAGGVVGFTAPRGREGRGDQDFFAHMWAAYLLPRHHVVLGRAGGAERWAEYWIDFRPPAGVEGQPPRGEVLARHPLGMGYRVAR